MAVAIVKVGFSSLRRRRLLPEVPSSWYWVPGLGLPPRVLATRAMLPFTATAVFILFELARTGSRSPIPSTFGLQLLVPFRDSSANRHLLLFIHGWRGDAQQTWRRFPELVLADTRFDDFNVISLDYPTFLARRNLTVTVLSRHLQHQLEFDQKVFSRYDSIVVIAHSMGGLIAREIALLSHSAGRARSFTRIIAVATPHHGANRARLMSALGISQELTTDMVAGSSYLLGLATRWNVFAAKPWTFCLGSPQDDVVDMSSATADCADYMHYTHGDHREVVKPDSIGDSRYRVPMSRVRQ